MAHDTVRNWLVTGGAGFIGSHITEFVAKQGHKVYALDNLNSGKEANLTEALATGRVEFLKRDIRDKDICDLMRDLEIGYVINTAAIPGVVKCDEDPDGTWAVNCGGLLNLLSACQRMPWDVRLVQSSSSSVYGDQEMPNVETQVPAPKGHYGTQKLHGEKMCAIVNGRGVTTINLRYFNVFGPRQAPDSEYAAVIPLFISRALDEERATINGDGEQRRDFTFVKNVVVANYRAALCDNPAAYGLAFNIGSGRDRSVNELHREIGKLHHHAGGKVLDPIEAPARKNEARNSRADISLAQRLIGYDKVVDFDEGLRMTYNFHRERRAAVPQSYKG